MRTILHEIADDNGLEIIDLTVQPDYGHLFVGSPPKHSPSLLADWFKGVSSRKYNHRYTDHDGEKIQWRGATTRELQATFPAKQSKTTSGGRRPTHDRGHGNAGRDMS